ncbi:MAG TPA: ferritin-like protein [Herpetosiphonaceae bacterium]
MTNNPELALLEETEAMTRTTASAAIATDEVLAPGQPNAGVRPPLRIAPRLRQKLQQGDKASVMSLLQDAIELEHSTIPPYLYALYSLDESKNSQIVDIIESVVVEEMLHMTLACNILNALGGTPVLDKPDFIPHYPGTLPGIEPPDPTWQVNLEPFSKDMVQKIFMQIELPEFGPIVKFAAASTDDEPTTIGQFYSQLEEQIAALDEGAFVSPPRNQVGPDIMPESIVVHDVPSMRKAIKTIIDQGEGTDTDPFDENGDPAHYYRFAETVKGRELTRTPPYKYEGKEVPLDPTGIFNVQPDRQGSGQSQAACTFNYTYTCLLKTLHAFFNGENNKDQFRAALGLMMSLKQQAKDMMSNLNVGPSFEYQPTLSEKPDSQSPGQAS